MYFDTAEVKRAASGRWYGLIEMLSPGMFSKAIMRDGKGHVPCPFHQAEGSKTPDFRFAGRGKGNLTGAAYCTCHKWSDGFELLMQANGWDFNECRTQVALALGLEPAKGQRDEAALAKQRKKADEAHAKALAAQEAAHAKALAEAERRKAWMAKVWAESVPFSEPTAVHGLTYLIERGCLLEPKTENKMDQRVIRCHPNLGYRHEDGRVTYHPTILSKVVDSNGKAITLHRIYTAGKDGKADVPMPKKMVATGPDANFFGAAIPLFDVSKMDMMGIAEGIETAITVTENSGVLTWSTVCADVMAMFTPPPHIKCLVVWLDKDASGKGLHAAQELAKRLKTEREDLTVILLEPQLPIPEGSKGVDWLDVRLSQGALGIPTKTAIESFVASLRHAA